MAPLVKYNVFCKTENKYVEVWREDVPTACPHNFRHEIDKSLIHALDVDTSVKPEFGKSVNFEGTEMDRCEVDCTGNFKTSSRVSQLAAGFQYGFHPGEWEYLQTVNNVPTSYYRFGDPYMYVYSIQIKQGSRTVKADSITPHNLHTGDTIIIDNSLDDVVNGCFVVRKINDYSFTFITNDIHSNTKNVVVPNITTVRFGRYYTGSYVPLTSIETDSNDESTLTLTTSMPYNFTQGTRLMISNTAANKTTYFDGEEVSYMDNATYSNVIDLSETYDSEMNTSYGTVITDKWIGYNTVFFHGSSNVDVDSNVITSASYFCGDAHNDSVCLSTGDTVVYNHPPWESSVAGLSNNQAYYLNVSDGNYQLYEYETSLKNSVNVIHYNELLDIFGTYSMIPGITETVSDIFNDDASNDGSVQCVCYFVPDYTGDVTFEIETARADMAFWFGIHDVFVEEDVTLSVHSNYRKKKKSQSVTISVTQDVNYPIGIRVSHKRNGKFYFKINGSTTTNGMLKSINTYSPKDTPVTFSSKGTSNKTLHRLFKAYLVTSAVDKSDRIVVSRKLTDSLADNQLVTVFSNVGEFEGIRHTHDSHTNEFYSYEVNDVRMTSFQFFISEPNGNQKVHIKPPNGVFCIVPIRIIQEKNTIHLPKVNEYLDDTDVLYEVISGSGIPGMVHGETYKMQKYGDHHAGFHATLNQIDLNFPGDGIIRLTQSIPSVTKDHIISPHHGLAPDDKVTYSNMGYSNIPGLANGAMYEVDETTTNSFTLRDVGGGNIDLTGAEEGMHMLTSDHSSVDGRYVVSRTLDKFSFNVKANYQIDPLIITFDGETKVIPNLSAMYIPSHGIIDSTKILYSVEQGSPIGGLSNNTEYWAHRLDNNLLRLKSSYESSEYILLTDNGEGSTHRLNITDIRSWTPLFDGVTVVEGSTNITKSKSNFEHKYKQFEPILIEELQEPIGFSVSNVDISTNVITVDSSHCSSSGDWIVYNGTSVPELDNGRIYYVGVSSSNSFTMHSTYDDSLSNVNTIDITTSNVELYGTFVKQPQNDSFKCTVLRLNDVNNIDIVNPMTFSSSNATVFRSTSMVPSAEGRVNHQMNNGSVLICPVMQPNSSFVRQTKTYFASQPGKSSQTSIAVNMKPSFNITSLSRSGLRTTAITPDPHNLTLKSIVSILRNPDTEDWAGEYEVISIPDRFTFEFNLLKEPLEEFQVTNVVARVNSWSQCYIRIGTFDQQTGFFFEYNGDELFAVRRANDMMLPGTVTVEQSSNIVKGTDTWFSKTVNKGDKVVIQGQVYNISCVRTDDLLGITPAYRGCSNSNVFMYMIRDVRVPQKNFNTDTLDGTGPSRYIIDLNMKQTVCIEKAYNGVGIVKLGFVDNQNKFSVAHVFDNTNTDMVITRFPNLPVRFEITSGGFPSYMPRLVHWGVTHAMSGGYDVTPRIPLFFCSNLIVFTGVDTVQFVVDTENGVQESVGFKTLVDAFNFDLIKNFEKHTALSGAGLQAGTKIVAGPMKTSSGGAVWLSLPPTVYSSSETVTAGDATSVVPTSINLCSMRIAPSVYNDFTGNLGTMDTVNRTLMVLTELHVNTTHDVSVEVVLSASVAAFSFTRTAPMSFVEACTHDLDDDIQGGLVIYSFDAFGGYNHTIKNTVINFENSLPLTNSMLGGDRVFPDGPEVVTLRVKPLDTTGICLDSPLKVCGAFRWIEK